MAVVGLRRTTTKDVSLLVQLEESGQLVLAPEFQRNSVWPRPAKAYLIDSILLARPIPPLFFLRTTNAQTGKNQYQVVDGQQRLRAVLEFIAGRFSLTQSEGRDWQGARWQILADEHKQQLLNYDFVVEELTGYQDADIRDMFARINRYVVPLNAQERRHAEFSSVFIAFAEELGSWPFWTSNRVFSAAAANRRRIDEFVEELAILLIEGPQDKKSSIDLYITQYSDEFEFAQDVRTRLEEYLALISTVLPDLRSMMLRRPANFYALIGALDLMSNGGEQVVQYDPERLGSALADFDTALQTDAPTPTIARYLRASSRQTDNLAPREVRIEVLHRILQTAV
ncbi:MAG TPA: DUF262 domain-containing protein [Propionicimonas sp.]|jgi:hypothetical protein